MRRAILQNVRELSSSVLPSLRVVALVYTGLGGFAAMFLVLAAAAMPKSPIIEQVSEPARQAVTSLVVQPTSDLVTSFFNISGPPRALVTPPSPTPAAFVAAISLDVTIDEAAEPDVQPTPLSVPAPSATRYVVPPAPEVDEQPTGDELVALEIVELPTHIATAVVESSPPEMHTASVEPPKPLPTPAPTLTAAQLKAQKEAENEAAIAANKAAQAQAKAAADAANRAAIQANMAAVQADDKAIADAVLTLPSAKPTAAPNVASDSGKAAAAAAKAEADAGNQAAIAAAKAAKAASQTIAAAVAKAAKH